MGFAHRLDGRLAAFAELRQGPQVLQRKLRRPAKFLAVIHQQDPPRRKVHLALRRRRFLEINHHMECRADPRLALHIDAAAHSVHDMLRNGQPQSGSLDLVHPAVVLPLEGREEFLSELLCHAHARILHKEMGAHVFRALRGFLLPQAQIDRPALRRELHRIAQEVQQHLIETHTVAENILRQDILDEDVEILPMGTDLGANDVADGLHAFPEGNRIRIQHHFAAFDFRHIQHIIDEPQKLLARKGDFPQTVLHARPIPDMLPRNGRHAHDGIHGRPDVMAHIGKEFAFRAVRVLRLLHLVPQQPALLCSLHLKIGKAENRQHNEGGQHQRRPHGGKEPIAAHRLDGQMPDVIRHMDPDVQIP